VNKQGQQEQSSVRIECALEAAPTASCLRHKHTHNRLIGYLLKMNGLSAYCLQIQYSLVSFYLTLRDMIIEVFIQAKVGGP